MQPPAVDAEQACVLKLEPNASVLSLTFSTVYWRRTMNVEPSSVTDCCAVRPGICEPVCSYSTMSPSWRPWFATVTEFSETFGDVIANVGGVSPGSEETSPETVTLPPA